MDLKIFISNRMKEASLAVFGEMAEKRKGALGFASLSGEKHIVIAPQNLTLSVEKAVLERLSLDGAFDIEILTVNRLAEKLLGAKAKKCLSPLGAVMLMRKVINACGDKLVYYRKSAKSEGFGKEIYKALLELRKNKVDFAEMKRKSEEDESPLGAKFKDLALLYEAYESELKGNYNDLESRLELFIEKMPELPELKNCHIYLVDFYSFTKAEYAVIEGFISCAKSVSAACVIGGGVRASATDTASGIRKIAERLNQPVYEKYIGAEIEKPFDFLHREIFSYKKSREEITAKERVALFSEPSVYDEIKSVAREIKKSVNAGARYMDIAVITQEKKFVPVIEDIFNRFEIPFFINRKESPLHYSAVRYLVSALNVISSSFKAEEVLTFIKNPFFDCPYGEKELFENYILAFNIDRGGFKKSFTLSGEGADLEAAEKIRKRFNGAIAPFIRNYEMGEDFIAAIGEFIERERFNEKIKKNIELKRSLGAENALKAEEQLFKIISDTVSEMRELLSAQKQSFDEMKSILMSAFDYYDIALIPLFVDSVYVGDFENSRFDNKRILFITGAVAGTYPLEQEEKPILSEYDLTLLKTAGIFVEPTALTKTRIAEQQLVDTLSDAEKLYISFPRLSLGGEAYAPSEFISAVNSLLFGGAEISSLHQKNKLESGLPPDEQLSIFLSLAGNMKGAFYEFLMLGGGVDREFSAAISETLKNNGYKPQLIKALKEKEPPISAGGAASYFKSVGAGKFSVSASQIESYAKCPMQHFLKYGLRLKPRRERELESFDVGNLFHTVLELYFKSIKDKIDQISLEEARELAKESIADAFSREEYLPLGSGAKNKNTLSLIGEECLRVAEKLTVYAKNSSFKPYALEMRFGFDEEEPFELNQGGNTFFLRGKIDRVDRCGDRVIVLDYKTGTVSEKLEEVYFGQRLQLYLYFYAMLKTTGLTPVGAFYVPIRDAFVKNEEDDERRYAYKGQILKDPQTFFEIDNEAEKTGKGSALRFTLKNGEFDKDKANAVSASGFASILKYTKLLAEKIIGEISEGIIAASPALDCKHCDFNILCPGGEKRETKLKNAIETIEKAAGEENG